MLAAMLAGRGKGQEQAKRQKRSDVLDSLGMEEPGPRGLGKLPRGGRGSAPAVPVGSVAGGRAGGTAAVAGAASTAAPAGSSAVAAGTGAQGTPTVVGQSEAAAGSAPPPPPPPPRAGLVPSEDEGAESASCPEPRASAQEASAESCATEPPAAGHGWKAAFAKARDRWDVNEKTLRSRYFHSKKRLYFEWDQRAGILFQYFSDEQEGEATAADDVPGLHAIWSTLCPEMHAEVWDVLPLPPTDPAVMEDDGVGLDVQDPEDAERLPSAGRSASRGDAEEAGEAADAGATAQPEALGAAPGPVLGASSPPREASSADQSLMPPPPFRPPPRKRRVGSDDVVDLEATAPGGASSNSAAASSGCGSGGSSSSSGAPEGPSNRMGMSLFGDSGEDDLAAERLPQAVDTDSDLFGKGPSILDSDDEEALPLGSEDCALPPAPADRAEPKAADLDLDMFAD